MEKEKRIRAILFFGLLPFVVSAMLAGCSLHEAPLREYRPQPYPPVTIKFISEDHTVQEKAVLGMDEAMAIAMADNHALRVARTEVSIAEGQLQQAKLLDNPEIDLSMVSSSAADSVLSIAGSLLQPIPLFWPKRQVAIAVAEASVERAKAEIQRFEWELRVTLKKTYLQVILQQNEKALFAQSLEIIEKLASTTARLKAGGEVSRLSELLVQSEVVAAKARLIELESGLAKKRSDLAILMGAESLPPLPDGTLELPQSLAFDPMKLSRTFAAGNLEIYLRDAEIRLAKLEHAAASNSWWPTPSLGVTAERDEESNRLFGGLFSLELPIFHRNQGEIQSRTAALAKVATEREQTEFIGRHTLGRLTILLRHGMELIALYRDEGLAAVEENLQLVQKAIAAGELSTLELITARQQAITMKLAYLQTQFGCVEILLDLEAVLGTPVFELRMVSTTPQENASS
jgi:cobalt-zinc-cadmium efflux system outer membrane protein